MRKGIVKYACFFKLSHNGFDFADLLLTARINGNVHAPITL